MTNMGMCGSTVLFNFEFVSDAQRKLEIKITSTADTTGAKQMGSSLANLNDWAKQTNYQMPQAAEAVDKVGKKAKTAAEEGLKKVEISGREVRLVTNELIPGVEGLGHAFTALNNPVLEGAFAFIVAKGLLDEFNKTLDETAQKNAVATFAESLKSVQEVAAATKQTLAEFADEMARGATETERANTAYEARMELLKTENEEGKKLGEARGENPVQQAYRDKADRESQLAARNDNLTLVKMRQAHLEEQAILSEQAAGMVKATKDNAQKQLDAAGETRAELTKKNQEAQDRLEKYGHGNSEAAKNLTFEQANMSQFTWSGFQAARDSAEKAAAAVALNTEEISKYSTILRQVDLSEVRAKEARAEAEKNKQFIDKEGPAIQSTFDANHKKDEDIYVADLKTKAGPFSGADIEEVARVENLERQHQQRAWSQGQQYDPAKDTDISDKSRDLVKRFEQYSKDHGNFLTAMLNQMFVLGGTQTTVMQRLPALESLIKRVQDLEARQNSGISGPSGSGG